MSCQLVPSLLSLAHFPAVPARMPVLADPPAIGTTFEVAEFIACAAMVRTHNSRPGTVEADSSVTVQVADVLKIKSPSVAKCV